MPVKEETPSPSIRSQSKEEPSCKHAARYYFDAGLLGPDPEPPMPATVVCFRCRGAEAGCPVCVGTGVASLSAHAAALRAAA